MRKIKNSGIYKGIILCFTRILIGILLIVGAIVYEMCINFIKEQRIRYNSQMIEKVSYEFGSIYLQINQLLNSLDNEKSRISLEKTVEGKETYPQLKRELEFEASIKNMMYSYDYQELVNGVLFYYGGDDYYYVGKEANSRYYDFRIEDYENPGFNSDYVVLGPVMTKNGDISDGVMRFVLRTGEKEQGTHGPFIMAEVKMDKLEERLEQLLSDKNVYCLIEKKSCQVYSCGGGNAWLKDRLMELIPRVGQQAGEQENTLMEKGVLVTCVSLKEYGWILAVADSQKILFQDIFSLMLKVEVMIGICGVFGILLAVNASRKLLFPVHLLRKIVSEMSEDRPVTEETEQNNEVTEVIALLKQMKSRIQELNARQYSLKVREQEAKLQMLQAQINPHFLYNTLNNIYCIAQIEEIESIVCLTGNLSKMMRYSVNNTQMFVSLREEMEHVRCYVDILNVRYENAITLHFDVPEELQKARVIKLLLQPLVENSCMHGIFPKKDRTGNVWIQAEKQEDTLILRVEDDGKGLRDDIRNRLNDVLSKKIKSILTPHNKGLGVALVNVNDRLRLLDGEGFGIKAENREDGGCRIIVRLKYFLMNGLS